MNYLDRTGGDWHDGTAEGMSRPIIALTSLMWVEEFGRHVIPSDSAANTASSSGSGSGGAAIHSHGTGAS